MATVMDHLQIPEDRRPAILKDKIVGRSKKGKAGALVMRKFSGVHNNVAKSLVKQFERNTSGREDIIEKLEAATAEKASESDLALLHLLRTKDTRTSLARLIVEAKAEPLAVMNAYARGCIVLGKVQAAIEAHSRLPALAKDIFRHALDQVVECGTCVGSGRVAAHSTSPGITMESKACPACKGKGELIEVSKHKEWTTKAALEMTGQIKGPGGPTVNVNQQVGIAVPTSGFAENLLKVSEKILYAKKEDVIEAEILHVQP